MQIFKAFKFELIPNSEQIRKMKQFCGCSRFVFNRALAWQNEQYDADETFKFSYTQVANFLPEWKRELVWLKECHSQVLHHLYRRPHNYLRAQTHKCLFAKRNY